MDQPVPDVSQSDVARIVGRDFAAEVRERVGELLDRTEEPLSPRVALAVLKLSDGDVEALAANVEVARADWRDVIAYAEYPEYMRSVGFASSVSDQRKREIIESDWQQYQSWLNRSG